MKFITSQSLLEAERALSTAERASELMEKRGDALTGELIALLEHAERLRAEIDRKLSEAVAALRISEMSDPGSIEAATSVVPADRSVRLYYTSLMGIELPKIRKSEFAPGKKLYGLAYSSPYIDDVYFRFSALRDIITELAETEAAVLRIAHAAKQARARADILKGVVVPEIRTEIARESLVQDEVEREEHARIRREIK